MFRLGQNENGNDSALYVATGIHAVSSALDMFNHLTFLYDPNWVYNKDLATLPLVFFNMTKITEVFHTDIAKNRVILYSASDNTDNAKMSSIAANQIKDPKHYRIEGVLPAYDISSFFNPINSHITAAVQSMEQNYFSSNESTLKGIVQGMNSTAGIVSSVLSAVADILASMSATTEVATYTKAVLTAALAASGMNGMFFNSLNVPYNKFSLENMNNSSHIITFKNWENWKYKYVIISDLSIEKNGEDGSMYRVSFDAQEIPVLIIKPSADVFATKKAWYATIQKTIYSYADSVVNTLGKVNL